MLEELRYILHLWNLTTNSFVFFWSLFSAVDMPYDSDEEADYSKMDLVGLIFTESYFKKCSIDINFWVMYSASLMLLIFLIILYLSKSGCHRKGYIEIWYLSFIIYIQYTLHVYIMQIQITNW